MVLILSMVVVLSFSIIGLSLAQTISAQYASYKQRLYVENAISATDAGISSAIAQLGKNTDFAGYTTEQELYSEPLRGKATYTVSVTTDANLNKILLVTGKSYRGQNDTTPANTKQVRAVAVLKREKISNSVIIGSGGMYMSQNSRVNKGNVYVRGQLSMETGSSIGSMAIPVMMSIANIGCGTTGPSSNWPQPCGAANPPIKMIGSGGTIYGTVCATDQSSSAGIVGTLTPGCISDISAAPTFNKKAFVQGINNSGGLVANGPSQSCPFGGGNFTIPANTKFVGTVTLDSPFGVCNITLEGDMYITGGLVIGNNVTLRVSENLGTTRPTVVANTGFQIGAATGKILRNTAGTPMFLLAFGSVTNAACANSEEVPSDTQQACLTNDQARQDANPLPINPVGGSGTVDLTGAVLYSYYGNFIIRSTNLTWAFYAFGAQGAGIAAGSLLSTVADDAPFGDLLYIPKYELIEYKQL